MNIEEKECELFGALLGDGYVSLACKKYIFGFTGNPKTDKEYYNYLSNLILEVWGKKCTPKFRCRGIRIAVCSKKVCFRLIDHFNFFVGEGKAFHAAFPQFLLEDWTHLRFAIRGFADTDGSVFCSKKPGVEKYPALELTTISKVLAEQLREALLFRGFRVAKVRSYLSKTSAHRGYKVCLYGKTNLKKWLEEIGFSNPSKHAKACALVGDY